MLREIKSILDDYSYDIANTQYISSDYIKNKKAIYFDILIHYINKRI